MRRKLPVFALLALVALMSKSLSATTSDSTVGFCAGPGTHYPTIQAAVNASHPGATVHVCPGIYPEQVTINKNLTLLGISSGDMYAPTVVTPIGGLVTEGSDITGNPVAPQILVQNANVTVSHITVDGNNNGLTDCTIDPIGIYYKNSSGNIINDAVRNVIMAPSLQGCQVGLAINVESSSGNPSVIIANNSVRNYDKNGITASGPGTGGGPFVIVAGNTVIGIGATTATAQNGIQISYGATGSVTSNNVADNIYTNPPCGGAGQPVCYGSSGILIYASSGINVSNNTVASTQLGIVPATDPTYGSANHTVIKSNSVAGTQTFDGIDLCSDKNTAQGNVIYGSAESGIHVDDECSPSTGSGNTVTNNTINEACAGILLGTGSSNTTLPNNFSNVTYIQLPGDSCTPPDAPTTNSRQVSSAKHASLRPSPFMKR
jgi:Right handed beta helix region